MILDLDVGNTRLKWRCVDVQDKLLARGALFTDDALEVLARQVAIPQRIRVACVRDDVFKEQMQARIRALWGFSAEFASSQQQFAGVITSYEKPESLGVDRWLTMLAARSQTRAACCIIDAGSALTVDMVRRDGQHLGGYIVPGLAMQRSSLLARTAIRLSEPANWDAVVPGSSTSTAVHHGIISMVVEWLIAVSEPFVQEGGQVYLTGGDAPILSTHLTARSVPHQYVADLVLEGLAVALP